MKISRLFLIILTSVFVILVFVVIVRWISNRNTLELASRSSNVEYTHWQLPKGAKARFGKGSVNDIKFSPDGKRFAVATPIGIWVYDGKTGKELSLLKKPGRDVSAIAFSPDNQIIAGASSNRRSGVIQFWDVANRELLKTIKAQQGISKLFFSDDGTKLASTGNFGRVCIWDISSILDSQVITQVRLEQIKQWRYTQLAELSPDMRFLAVTDEDWKNEDYPIYIFDGTNGNLLHTLTGHTRRIKSIAFSSDSETLISAGEYEIRIWNLETGKPVLETYWREKLPTRSLPTHTIMFSPSSNFLINGHFNFFLLSKKIKEQPKDSERIVDYHQHIKIEGHKDLVYRFTFSHDERTLLSVSKDGTIRGWDTASGEEHFVCGEHIEKISGLILSKTGDTLTTLNQPGNPIGVIQRRTWDTQTGNLLSTDFGREYIGQNMGISQDNKLLATYGVDGKGILQNIETESFDVISKFSLREFPRIDLNVRFAFSEDSKMLAASGEDGSVHVWKINKEQSLVSRLLSDLKKMQLMFKVNGPSEFINTLGFSPDGRILATGGMDKIIKLWNVTDGTLLFTLIGHESYVDTLVFSPDGKTLASGNENLHLWDVENGIELRRIPGKRGFNIDTLLYSPDGNTIIMGGSDGIHLYDTRLGFISSLYLGSTDRLQFSADGKTLMSVEGSGSVLIWDWGEITSTL